MHRSRISLRFSLQSFMWNRLCGCYPQRPALVYGPLSLPFVSRKAGILLPRFVLSDSLEAWPFSFGSIDFDFFVVAFLKNDTETF